MRQARKLSEFVKPYRVESGKKFRMKDFDPADTHGLCSEFKGEAAQLLQQGVEKLAELQDMLYAQEKWAVLLIFQAMDAAGKDGTIKHVMSGVNPQGVQVYSFKAPSAEELDHDFLWRTTRCLPERGRIGIFNRSYYEEVLVVRVHPTLVGAQRIPESLIGKHFWEDRFESINCFEKHLARNGTVVRKFFLHVSKGEQKKRFLKRLDEPEKNWKFSAADIQERGYWKDYQEAYEDMIRNTASEESPWFVVPADNKWFTRLVVVASIVDALKSLGLSYPEVPPEKRRQLQECERALRGEQQQKNRGSGEPKG